MAPDLRGLDAGVASLANANGRLSDMGCSRGMFSAPSGDGGAGNAAEEMPASTAAGGGGGNIDEVLNITWSLHDSVNTPVGRLSRHSSFEEIFAGIELGEENFPVSPGRHARRRSAEDLRALFESFPLNCDPPNAGAPTTAQDIFVGEARGDLVDKIIRETCTQRITRKRSADLGLIFDGKIMSCPSQDAGRDSTRFSARLRKTLEERNRQNRAAAEANKSSGAPSLAQQQQHHQMQKPQHQQQRHVPGSSGSLHFGQPQQEEVVDPPVDLIRPPPLGPSSDPGHLGTDSKVGSAPASAHPSLPLPCPLHGHQPFHTDAVSPNRVTHERENRFEAAPKYFSDGSQVPAWMVAEKDFLSDSQIATCAAETGIQGGGHCGGASVPGAVAMVRESVIDANPANRTGNPAPLSNQPALSGKRTNSEMSLSLGDDSPHLKRCHHENGTPSVSTGSLERSPCKQSPMEAAGDSSATKQRRAERADRRSTRRNQVTCPECSKPHDEKMQELQETVQKLSEALNFMEEKCAEQQVTIKGQRQAIGGLCRENKSLSDIIKRLQETVENLGGSADLW